MTILSMLGNSFNIENKEMKLLEFADTTSTGAATQQQTLLKNTNC